MLLSNHYIDFPYKSKFIQKFSGGLILYLTFVAIINFLNLTFGLNDYFNTEILKLLLIIFSLKFYGVLIDYKMVFFFEDY